MTLIHDGASDYQLATVSLDAGNARDIALMLTSMHALLDGLAATAAARQAAAVLDDTDSPYTLQGLAGAAGAAAGMLFRAWDDATAGIP